LESRFNSVAVPFDCRRVGVPLVAAIGHSGMANTERTDTMTQHTIYKTDLILTTVATAGIRNMAGSTISVLATPDGGATVSPTSLQLPFDSADGFVFSNPVGQSAVSFEITLENPGGTDSIYSVSANPGFYIDATKTQEGFPFDLAVFDSSSSPPSIGFNALALG
jgi:hypothetical protein